MNVDGGSPVADGKEELLGRIRNSIRGEGKLTRDVTSCSGSAGLEDPKIGCGVQSAYSDGGAGDTSGPSRSMAIEITLLLSRSVRVWASSGSTIDGVGSGTESRGMHSCRVNSAASTMGRGESTATEIGVSVSIFTFSLVLEVGASSGTGFGVISSEAGSGGGAAAVAVPATKSSYALRNLLLGLSVLFVADIDAFVCLSACVGRLCCFVFELPCTASQERKLERCVTPKQPEWGSFGPRRSNLSAKQLACFTSNMMQQQTSFSLRIRQSGPF